MTLPDTAAAPEKAEEAILNIAGEIEVISSKLKNWEMKSGEARRELNHLLVVNKEFVIEGKFQSKQPETQAFIAEWELETKRIDLVAQINTTAKMEAEAVRHAARSAVGATN